MRGSAFRWGFFAAALLLLGRGTARADAEVEAGAQVNVRFDVQVISASSAPGGTDPRLATLQKRLADFKFASYRLVSEKAVTLGLKTLETLALPGGRTLEIRPRKFEKSGRLRVHLHLRGPNAAKLMDTDYAIEKGGDLLVGGPKLDDGTLLVFLHHEH